MNAILFETSAGSPIAVLLMSTPTAPVRDGVFNMVVVDSETFDSREGQAILPEHPSEYACRYAEGGSGVSVAFENQNGWRFSVSLDPNRRHGDWLAEKDGEWITGQAVAL